MKSVGGMSRREAEQIPDRSAGDLADEVVERRIERTLGAAVPADGLAHRVARQTQALRRRVRLTDHLEQERVDRSHRLGGVAIEAVRVPLADSDQPRKSIVLELHGHRGHEMAAAVIGAGDAERFAEVEGQGLVTDPEGHAAPRRSFALTHGSASTAG